MTGPFIEYPEIEDTRHMRTAMAALSNAVHADASRFDRITVKLSYSHPPTYKGLADEYSYDPETGEILE